MTDDRREEQLKFEKPVLKTESHKIVYKDSEPSIEIFSLSLSLLRLPDILTVKELWIKAPKTAIGIRPLKTRKEHLNGQKIGGKRKNVAKSRNYWSMMIRPNIML